MPARVEESEYSGPPRYRCWEEYAHFRNQSLSVFDGQRSGFGINTVSKFAGCPLTQPGNTEYILQCQLTGHRIGLYKLGGSKLRGAKNTDWFKDGVFGFVVPFQKQNKEGKHSSILLKQHNPMILKLMQILVYPARKFPLGTLEARNLFGIPA